MDLASVDTAAATVRMHDNAAYIHMCNEQEDVTCWFLTVGDPLASIFKLP
jgi:hypothetical protein